MTEELSNARVPLQNGVAVGAAGAWLGRDGAKHLATTLIALGTTVVLKWEVLLARVARPPARDRNLGAPGCESGDLPDPDHARSGPAAFM